MLESIRTLTDIPSCDDRRFLREDIVAARNRRLLLEQAQRRARECIAEANAEVDSIRAYAFQEGYAQGMMQASTEMARMLVQSCTLTEQLRTELAQGAAQLLGTLLARDEWLDDVLSQWLNGQGRSAQGTLQVVLPQRCRAKDVALAARLRELWSGPVSIEYHPQERYLLRLVDQVLEFDIESIQARLVPRLLAQLNGLPAAVRMLDQQALQVLKQTLAGYTDQVDDHPLVASPSGRSLQR
jgi:hypothetical protein